MAKRNVHGSGACNFKLPKTLRGSGCATEWPPLNDRFDEAYRIAMGQTAEDDFQNYLDSQTGGSAVPVPVTLKPGEYQQ